MPIVRASGLLVSLCTITVPPTGADAFDDGGARNPNVPYVPLAGHIDIPCTAPPINTGDSVSPSEIKALEQIEAVNLVHVLLDDYYPSIISDYRAVIDGVNWDIVNVESDSQKQMTRLAVKKATI
jgi:hypothetical protein